MPNKINSDCIGIQYSRINRPAPKIELNSKMTELSMRSDLVCTDG